MFQLVNSISSWMDFSFINDFRCNLLDRLDNYRKYRQTVNELSALSDRELNDIGINRGMITSIASEMYNPNLKGWV